MNKYLDKNGLLYLWAKISARFDKKVDKEDGKTLTSNDFTDELKRKLEGVGLNGGDYVLPVANESTLGGVMKGDNIIIDGYGKLSVSVMAGADGSEEGSVGLVPAPSSDDNMKFLRGDGVWAVPAGKDYKDVTQSESGLMSSSDKKKLDAFGPAADYALKSDIADVYNVAGSVTEYDELPGNPKKGDVYNVQETGMNYVWTGSEWDSLGSVFSIESIDNTEIDEVVGS